jgi:hypothetical protein
MFDGLFDNKMVGAAIVTSGVSVILVVCCCCVKKFVYDRANRRTNTQVNTRHRLDSQFIPSAQSAFKTVSVGSVSNMPPPSAPPIDI